MASSGMFGLYASLMSGLRRGAVQSRCGRYYFHSLTNGNRGVLFQKVQNVSQPEVEVEMPPCDFEPEPYEGISLDEAMKSRVKYLNPALKTMYKQPMMLHQGHMQWLWDSEGRRYLDMFGGVCTVSVGHCHPHVTRETEKQLKKLWHTTNLYYHPKVHEYAEKLVSKMPGDLKICYFVNSGSEANDMAMMLARLHTGNFDIISLRNAYHGGSPYTLGLTASNLYTFNVANGFGCHQTMNPDPYRGLFGGANCRDSHVQTTRECNCSPGFCQAEDQYVDQLKDVLKHSTAKKVAGIFAEAIQGVGGVVQFPKGYLKKATELIREHGGLYIADEVQTGFARLGSHFWGFESHDVVPDIVTMAKGIGNGFPMAAVITTPEIAMSMTSATHANTFGGNALACAAGNAVLEVIEEENIQQRAADMGALLLQELAVLRDEFEVVGDVRGKGLMIGVELVSDKLSRTPLPPEKFSSIWEDTKRMGVLFGRGGFHGNVLRIKPPMCITPEDAHFVVAVIRKSLERHAEGYGA